MRKNMSNVDGRIDSKKAVVDISIEMNEGPFLTANHT